MGDKTIFQGFSKSPLVRFGISAASGELLLELTILLPLPHTFSSSLSRDPSSGISSWFCCSILTTPSLAALPNPAGKMSGTREKNQQRIHQNPARTPPLLDFHHLGRNSFPGPPQGSTWLSHELKAQKCVNPELKPRANHP